jgi:GNAT superfamily N-acetyltransferase
VILRPARDTEHRFIVETTLKVLRPRQGWTWRAWSESMAPEVDTLVRAREPLVVADGDVVIGFAMMGGASLYMLYVKANYRGYGFGAALLERLDLEQPIACWNVTDSWRAWARGRGLRWRCERGGKAAA